VNRYVLQGLVGDLAAGRRVLVITESVSQARFSFEDAVAVVEHLDELPAGLKVRRANGDESISTAAGGRLSFRTRRGPSSLRGLSVDVVFVDVDPTPELMEALYPMVATSRGELIRR